MESFDLLLWRRALADAAPVPTACDLADWAGQLGNAGEGAASALLADVAAIIQGFSPQAVASRGGATAIFAAPAAAAAGAWTLHQAMAELRLLAQRAAAVRRPRLNDPPGPAPSGRPDNPAGIGDGIPAPAASSDIVAVAHRLRALLEDADAETGELATLLAGLVEADRRYPTLDYRTLAQSPLTSLAPAIAAAGLIDFALSTRDLWSAPSGSPALFHHVARLDSAGLGPYLDNVGRLTRDSADMFDLARMAQSAASVAGDDAADPAAWLVLLSRGCPSRLLNEIIDDLGDAAMHGALMAVLRRVASRPASSIDIAKVMRLRDAGLDNGDYLLAARAQQVIVRLRPNDKLEEIILGSIEASGGEFGRAEAIFRYWLGQAPDDPELRERLLAVRTDRFDRFALPHGFGSPTDRRDARLRRRGVPPDYPRRRGERIRAVDVG